MRKRAAGATEAISQTGACWTLLYGMPVSTGGAQARQTCWRFYSPVNSIRLMARRQGVGLRAAFQTADRLVRRSMKTGVRPLDTVLAGGLEFGLVHLLYGDSVLHRDVLRTAVHAQLPPGRGGAGTTTVIIDSANIIDTAEITDMAFEEEMEPEDVMDRIYVSRAFNSAQTYELVMNRAEEYLDMVSARLLIVAGLPQLYIQEGMTGEGAQEMAHMATKLMTMTLRRQVITVVTAPRSEKGKHLPAGGTALASCAQVHVHIEESRAYIHYTLTKHPQYPVRRASVMKTPVFRTALPLTYFLDRGGDQGDL